MVYSEIPYKNDRTRLVLNKYWPGAERKELRKLRSIYMDNEKYEDAIIYEMVSLGYIKIEGGDRYSEENGKCLTTESGFRALSTEQFPSEVETKKRDRWFRILTFGCSALASLAGLDVLVKIVKTIIRYCS